MRLDVAIFGGGAAGLWLYNRLRSQGLSTILAETNALGTGQTISSQGILHGGLKYTLSGLLTPSAREIRDLPAEWKLHLSGQGSPDLSETVRRADSCFLWRSRTLRSRVGMWGARWGLKTVPQPVKTDERPHVLRQCPGEIHRLPEQVVSPASLLTALAKDDNGLLHIDSTTDETFTTTGPGRVTSVHLEERDGKGELVLEPRWVVFAAGAGNAALRRFAGLSGEAMQRRPLHMVVARGPLPSFNGHCVDGAKTRVTITSDTSADGTMVTWQIGGEVAERGVRLSSRDLMAMARRELLSVLPGISFEDCKWATYRVDRAEPMTRDGLRPEGFGILEEGNCLTAWPTKLVLAPRLADTLAERIGPTSQADEAELHAACRHWNRPSVAAPPWENAEWLADSSIGGVTAPRRAA